MPIRALARQALHSSITFNRTQTGTVVCMIGHHIVRIPSFDGTEIVLANLRRPDRYSRLFQDISEAPRCIPRGGGLSYCAASTGQGIVSISSQCFNRILAFDKEKGSVTVECGVTVGQLFEWVVKHAWIPPVLPGHPSITVGGSIGFNVHGKSQFHSGNFGDWIEMLWVYHPDHGEQECSKQSNAELFYLTIGGFGLTGFITKVQLRLKKITGNSIVFRRYKTKNLIDAVNIMEEKVLGVDYLYSWNDLNLRGSSFGKGIVYTETFAQDNIPSSAPFHHLSAQNRPLFNFSLFNAYTLPVVLAGYQIKERISQAEVCLDLNTAAFPINGKEIYFKLFGKRGFREYQMLLPRNKWEDAIPIIENTIKKYQVPTALCSLKLFQGTTEYLNFCGSGVCLVIDVPAIPNALLLYQELDELVIKCGGIVNLSKDSRLSAQTIRHMFPEYQKFVTKIQMRDPNKRFDSELRRRIEI